MLSPDFKEFVQLLNKNDVQYMIVGGYAVGIHGHPRYTGDLDIWLLPTQENALKIIRSDECYSNKKVVTIDGLQVNFIGYHDLIKNKKASGRHQDLGDVDHLQE